MIEKYIDVLFKAVEMKDMELIMFVLSKDTSVEKFRKLKSIKNYSEGNIYEHLLFKKDNEILRLFLDAGLLQVINEPINDKNELFIDLAYRYKNLPLILSLLDEKEVDLNIKTNGISFLEKVTTTFSFENTILEHLRETRPELPVDTYKNEKVNCELLSKIIVDESAFPVDTYENETFVDKILPKDKQAFIKSGFLNLSQSIKNKLSDINTSQNKKEEVVLNNNSDIKDNKIVHNEPIEGELVNDNNEKLNKPIDEVEEIVVINVDKKKS